MVTGSLANEEDNINLVNKAIETSGQLDVLINNAGFIRPSPVESPNILKDFDLMIGTNLRGTLHLSALAVPHLKATKGNIVNVSSVASFVTFDNHLVYAITKAGITKMTKSLAAELGAHGVRVNEVNPGYTETHFIDSFGLNEERRGRFAAALQSMIPIKKTNLPEDVAKAIIFLASDEKAGTTSGLSYVIDGGQACRAIKP